MSLYKRLHEQQGNGSGPVAKRRDPILDELRQKIHHHLIDELGPILYDKRLSEDDLRRRVQNQLQAALAVERSPLSAADKAQLIQEVSDDILGYGPIDRLLKDQDVTEVMATGPTWSSWSAAARWRRPGPASPWGEVRTGAAYGGEMVLIGLTGGIGSGKSAVSARLAARGAVVIDADAIVRELQAPGQPVLSAMVERFGEAILGPGGTLDRQSVADLVFGDPDALADLNAIVHPAVGAEIANRLEEHAGTDQVVVLDVPLLVESGRSDLAALIVVDVDPEVAVARLVEHRGLRAEDARARMARQVSRQDRLAHADLVIDNTGDLTALDAEVARAWDWITSLPRP